MIKLKQLKKIDNDVTLDDSRNFSMLNDTNASERTSFSPQQNKKLYKAKYYFDSIEAESSK